MFKVKNISPHDVVLSDLRIVLSPGQVIDLDKVAPRYHIDLSQSVRLAKIQKKIKLVDQDGEKSIVPEVTVGKKDLEEMEKRLTFEMRQQMAAKKRSADKKQKKPKNNDVSILADAVKQLIEQVQNQKPATIVQGNPAESVIDSHDVSISDDNLTMIHARSVERMSQNITGNIETTEKTINDKNLSQNIDELGDLL